MTYLDFERYAREIMGEHVSKEYIQESYSKYVSNRVQPCDLDEEQEEQAA